MNSDVNILLLPLCFLGLYMILEAADWGLSLAAPLISRNRQENEAILNLMKPGLDGNELWFFMGLFMIQMAFPLTGESLTAGTAAVVVLVVLGALLRLFAVLAKKYFSSPLAIKIMSILSLAALAVMGFASTAFLLGSDSLYSIFGGVCAVWFILSSFQIGCLYGAVKVVNPLGERFRAAFLVSSVLSVVVYLIFAFLVKGNIGESSLYSDFFWISLVATAILFGISFAFTRMRHVKVGLAAAYCSSFFAIAIYLAAYAVEIPVQYPVQIGAVKAALAGIPSTAILALAVVWTFGVFIWRQIRKKQKYQWEDHI